MSKKHRREAAQPAPVTVVHDPQAIAAAMEDTVETVSEDVPHAPDITETVPDLAGRDVAGKPSTVHLEDAIARWGLVPADVLAWRGFEPEVESVLVTAGGRKLRWPDDEARVLTEADKGRAVYTPAYPEGYLRRRV